MKTIKNYFYNLSYQILVLILPLVLTPYISRVLEVDGIGQYSVATAIANYFILFGMLGINSYGNRQVAYVRDDKVLLIQTFWEINLLKFITMGISVAFYLIFVIFFVSPEKRILYFVECITLLASLFDISWYFAGMEEFNKTATRNIIVKLTGVSLVFLFVKSKSDLWVYALILAVATLVGQIVMWITLPRDFRKIVIDRKKMPLHLKKTIQLWLPSIAIQVYSSLDKVMLGYLVNDVQVGLYESSQKIVKMASTITTSLSTVLVPRMANLYINGRDDEFKYVADKAFAFVSFIAIPLCFGVMAIRNSLVPWFYGIGYEDTSKLLLISSWLIITLGWSSIFGLQVLVSAKKEKEYTFSVTIGACVNIVLNFCFIIRYQAAGALVASVLAEYTGMFLMAYFSRNLVDLKKCFSIVPKYIGVSTLMSIVTYLVGEFLGYTFFTTVIQILVGALVYFGLLFCMHDEIILIAIEKIKVKIHY